VGKDSTRNQFAIFVVPFNLVRAAFPSTKYTLAAVDDRTGFSTGGSDAPFEVGHAEAAILLGDVDIRHSALELRSIAEVNDTGSGP